MQSNTEEKLKRAAELYAKREGEALLAEIEEIRRQKVSYLLPRADKVVRGLARPAARAAAAPPARRRALFGAIVAAACIMLVARIALGTPELPLSGDSALSAAPAAPETAARDEAEAGRAPAPSPPAAADTNKTPALIPISFALPADYHEISSDLDNGLTVYGFESANRGDVVLTMCYTAAAGGGASAASGFTEVLIDGTPVPAKVEDSYMLLAFESGGVNYTLSSEDDLGALAAFYRSIAV